MSGVLSPRRRLYEPEAAGFRPQRTKVRLPATAGHAGENPCAALLIDPDFIIWPSFMNWKLLSAQIYL
jgi:hypothetical protein